MRIQEYPRCCAILCLTGFIDDFVPEDIMFEEQKAKARKWIRDSVQKYQPLYGLLTVAIREDQKNSGLGKILREEGFKVLEQPFYHPKHGHHVILYSLVCHPKKQKELKNTNPINRDQPRLIKKPVSRRQFQGDED